MKRQIFRLMSVLLGVAMLLAAGCSSNKLVEYDLRDSNIAARTFMPPRANVFTNFDLSFDPHNIAGAAIKIGTTIARESQAAKARARLDSAMTMVNVPAIIEEEVLLQAAEMLNFRPVNEVEAADFVFNVDMQKYGIDAQSWDGGTFFVIDAKVELIDAKLQRRVWKGHVDAHEPLSPGIFGLGGSIGNVLDAMALSELSVEEMAIGMEHLANFSAGLVAEKLYRDYVKSRE